MYVVYCHVFPNKKKYVGITCQKPEYRWNNGNGYKKQSYIYNAILKYGWHNIEHKILYNNLTKNEAEIIEEKIIKEWKLQNKKYGYNLCDGGNTKRGFTRNVSIETKKILSDTHMGEKNPMYGKHSWNYGKKLTKEHKEKLKISKLKNPTSYWKGKKRDLSFMHDKLKIKVEKYDLNFNLLDVYNSIAEAAKDTGLKSTSGIVEVCKGKRKTAGGFIWKYNKN